MSPRLRHVGQQHLQAALGVASRLVLGNAVAQVENRVLLHLDPQSPSKDDPDPRLRLEDKLVHQDAMHRLMPDVLVLVMVLLVGVPPLGS